MLETAATPGERRRYLRAVGSFRDPAIVDQVLAYILENPLNPNDITMIAIELTSPDESKQQVLDWLMVNDAQLRQRLPDGAMANIPYYVLSCSEEPLETVRSFYGDESRHVPGIDNALTQSEARTRNCAQLRNREQASVAQYLHSFLVD